jgi:hypothetical protein
LLQELTPATSKLYDDAEEAPQSLADQGTNVSGKVLECEGSVILLV